MKKEKRDMKNKRGRKANKAQVTVFIILALAIVVVLILLFLGRDRFSTIISGQTPIQQVQTCIDEPLQVALDKISVQGGSLEPENYYIYQGNKVEYLCYTEENYAKCVMQKPLLKQSIEKELEDYIQPRAKNCIENLKTSLQKQGYTVSSTNPTIDVSLIPGNIVVEINSELSLEKSNEESYKSIKMDYPSKLYDLVMVSSSIINWEARYGDSETMNYMIYYPNLKVEKKKQGEGSTIYVLTDRMTEDKFMFASRSIVIPAGLTGQ